MSIRLAARWALVAQLCVSSLALAGQIVFLTDSTDRTEAPAFMVGMVILSLSGTAIMLALLDRGAGVNAAMQGAAWVNLAAIAGMVACDWYSGNRQYPQVFCFLSVGVLVLNWIVGARRAAAFSVTCLALIVGAVFVSYPMSPVFIVATLTMFAWLVGFELHAQAIENERLRRRVGRIERAGELAEISICGEDDSGSAGRSGNTCT